MKPLIGIMPRCYVYDIDYKDIQYTFEFVRNTIIEAGGEPFFLTPPQDVSYYSTRSNEIPELTEEEKRSINFWLDSVNGIFMPGGDKFTSYDLYVVEQAIKKDIPLLGVCLGLQAMSTYKQDHVKLEKINTNIDHNIDDDHAYVHTVMIDEDSKLYQILGEKEIGVNSHHEFRGCENENYKVVARSSDGVIEAIEMPDKTFHIGLQWHPEKMYNYDKFATKIIDAFIEASKSRKGMLDDLRENYR